MLDRIRDFLRGYSEADVNSATRKLEDHWRLPAGCIIPMSGREMRAIVGERMMEQFKMVRDLEFVNHPRKAKLSDDIGERV
jgi:hypothetical protein